MGIFYTKNIFLDDVVTTVEMKNISAEMILNWGQAGVKLVPSTSCSLEHTGTKRVEVAGLNDKCLVTAILYVTTLQGDFLQLQLIYKEKQTVATPSILFHHDGM